MRLSRLHVDGAVHRLRPDFAVVAMAVWGLGRAESDTRSETWLLRAEAAASARAQALHPHVAAWHDAYRAFGAKPQRTAPSVDALCRRAATPAGLPRVNWLVDLYNAISVLHALPVGGEDLSRFAGPIRLVRAAGTEPFDTVKDGHAVVETAAPGEVVWADDLGVTCRRWNWRQGTRTRLTDGSVEALFLFERLEPLSLDALDAAADALVGAMRERYPDIGVERRRLGPAFAPLAEPGP